MLYVGDEFGKNWEYRAQETYSFPMRKICEENCDLLRAMELLENNINERTELVLIHAFHTEFVSIIEKSESSESSDNLLKEFLQKVNKHNLGLKMSYPNVKIWWVLNEYKETDVQPSKINTSFKCFEQDTELECYKFELMVNNLNDFTTDKIDLARMAVFPKLKRVRLTTKIFKSLKGK